MTELRKELSGESAPETLSHSISSFPTALKAQLEECAWREGRTLNREIIWRLERSVEDELERQS